MRLTFALAFLVAAAGCGGDSSSNPDLGASPDLSGGGAQDLAMTVLTGTNLVAGDLDLYGVTTDGYVLYTDAQATAFAVSSKGGQPVQLTANFATGGVSNGAIFVWHDGDGNGNGPLTVWTQATGAHEVATGNSFGGLGAVSSDSKLIAFFDNLDQNAALADLVVANSDGTAKKTLQTGVFVGSSSCTTTMDFIGTRIVLGGCAANNMNPQVVSFDASGVSTVLLAVGTRFVADGKGTVVFAWDDAANAGTLIAPTGGASLAKVTDVVDAKVLPDGSAVVYASKAAGLNRLVSGGTPTALQAAGATAVDAISADGKWVLYHGKVNQDGLNDILIASTSTMDAPAVLSATPTAASGGIFGASFTADSGYALFFSSVDAMNLVGTLQAAPTAGGPPKALSKPSGAVVAAASGSTVAFNDNFTAVSNSGGTADLYTVSAAGGAPVLVATQAKVDFNVTSDGKTVIYSHAPDGLFAAGVQ